MRIVLSRKGFDAANGGGPSPIFPDGRLLSLPIPSRGAPVTYADIDGCGERLDRIVEDLSGGRIRGNQRAHLDPDLSPSSLPRLGGWRAAFGQVEAAQAHLAGQGVGHGDLFLFFGWFRRVELMAGRWRYAPNAPDLHVLFGWLQIDNVLPIGASGTKAATQFPWLAQHPHVHSSASNNTIYVGAERLTLPDRQRADAPGAGVFGKFSSELVLTDPGQRLRSVWLLPSWFKPGDRRRPLSYHGDVKRWTAGRSAVKLHSVGRGQEFVLHCDDYPESLEWAARIVTAHQS